MTKCPNCDSENVARERRPNGNDKCLDCGAVWPSNKPAPDPRLTMTDAERLEKLTQAVSMIRDVEFSMQYGEPDRAMIYSVMVDSFSLTKIGAYMTRLRKKVKGY